jgi:hypothetical protein
LSALPEDEDNEVDEDDKTDDLSDIKNGDAVAEEAEHILGALTPSFAQREASHNTTDLQIPAPELQPPTQRLFVVSTISQDRTGNQAEVIGRILARP